MMYWVIGCMMGFGLGVWASDHNYKSNVTETKIEQCTIAKPSGTECKLYVTYKPFDIEG